MAQLKIFSASAGSGKTYTLARQVIDLLVADPRSYAHVLAVTFTNKATGEMKERIVGDLDLMANGADGDPAREGLLSVHVGMCRSRGDEEATRAKVVGRAKTALMNILLDYGQFSVSTIDRFVQRVIRSFAYEQGLPSNYGLQLDTEPVIDSAVDDLMESLATDSELRKLVIAMTEEAIDTEKAWNLAESQIAKIGKALLDEGANVAPGVLSPGNISALRKAMEARRGEAVRAVIGVVHDIQARLSALGSVKLNGNKRRFVALVNAEIPDADASDGGREAAMFAADAIETLADLDADTVVTKQYRDAASGFVGFVKESVAKMDGLRRQLNTAEGVLANVKVIGVMGRLANFIRDVEARNNKMNMSGSGKLLSDLIDDCPVPFVYEKIGVRYDTIMIDEFQDTSFTQYGNFRPLLSESLSEGHDCLLVGDVKQSIYRFRGGDWQLLGRRVQNDFVSQAELLPLNDNYRSKSQIVNFNNALFATLPGVMDRSLYSGGLVSREGRTDVLEVMYDGAAQNPKKGDDGYVRMSIISVPSAGKELARKFVENDYVSALKDVLSHGYSYSDVCILVRKATEAQAVIERLGRESWNGEPIPIMSDDSLFVMSSDATLCLADVMRYLVTGERAPLFAALKTLRGVTEEALGEEFARGGDMGAEIDELRGLGVLELIGEVVNRMPKQLRDAESLYIDAFRQQIMEALKDGDSDISSLVRRIDDNKRKWTVWATSSRPAVKIMTIHKSKGLEFKVVIIPNCDWELENFKGKSSIWCPADRLDIPSWRGGVLPLTYNKNLADSDFKEDYVAEREQLFADNLNMAYVAFTRPKDVLLAWGVKAVPKTDKAKVGSVEASGSIAKYLSSAFEEMTGDAAGRLSLSQVSVDEDARPSDDGGVAVLDVCAYVDGKLPSVEVATGVVANVAQLNVEVAHSCDPASRFKINAEAESRILSDAEEEDDAGGAAGTRALMISVGLTNHSILERVISLADLHKAVSHAVLSGLLSRSEAEAREAEMSRKISEDPVVAEWFDHRRVAKVWTETSMVGPSGDAQMPFARRRPDRVMRMADGRTVLVDYKFGKRSPKHHAQVREYVRWLEIAGFKDVEAYLWYYSEGGVEKVGL